MPDTNQKYRLIEKLDAGGMAEIYRGEAESLHGFKKQVAIKRILPHLTKNQKFVAMFLDEARLSLHLTHANIVHVFDIGRSGSTYFIVMEYVDGINLRTAIDSLRRQNGRFELSQAVFVIMEVCKGLGYAHEMINPEDGRPLNIVHRDVSPPNILLSKMGEVKIVDFGLAKARSQIEQTDPGVVKGKFSYLSPEAASGMEVDSRADIFACGIILFELLTGRRLFYGETDYQTVELVRQARIPPLTSFNPQVPRELEQVVQRSLAREAHKRYRSAYEMQDALAQVLFGRGLKVTSRDIAQVVRECQSESQRTHLPTGKKGNVIDGFIQEEVLKFTSLDAVIAEEQEGSKPLTPESISGLMRPGDLNDMVDPRSWTDEMMPSDSHPQADAVRHEARPSLPEVGSLEQMLEGEGTAPVVMKPKRKKKRHRNLVVGIALALLVFLMLSATALLVLYKFDVLGAGADENADIYHTK